ncbi:MAG: hypothetical protein ABL874_08065 [Sphingopyxis sp.]
MITSDIIEDRDRQRNEAFRRIHRLIKRGYVVDWSVTDVEDALWMNHPGRGPNLILYADGKIVSLDKSATLDASPKASPDRIYNDTPSDAKLFDRWLTTVPMPTWRERTAANREQYIWQPGCLVLFFLISLAIGKILEMIWKSVVGP